MNTHSLLPLDVGFDLRATRHAIRLEEGAAYRYINTLGEKAVVGPPLRLREVAAVLGEAGYVVDERTISPIAALARPTPR